MRQIEGRWSKFKIYLANIRNKPYQSTWKQINQSQG